MQIIAVLLKLLDGYKTYATTLAAVFAALALVFGGDYIHGVPALALALKALLTLATGGAVASLRHAIAKANA